VWVAGDTSWCFWKLRSYSIEVILNFSDTPFNIASYTGFFTFLLSLVIMVFVVLKTMVLGDKTNGLPSTNFIKLFF
ncbi:glycosyltransferase, partial [Streptococcus suis]